MKDGGQVMAIAGIAGLLVLCTMLRVQEGSIMPNAKTKGETRLERREKWFRNEPLFSVLILVATIVAGAAEAVQHGSDLLVAAGLKQEKTLELARDTPRRSSHGWLVETAWRRGNGVGEGRSRSRGMRLIRTSTVCPASKRSGVLITHGRAKNSIAYRHSLQKQPIHSPTHIRSLGTHIYTKTGCKLLILWCARADSNCRPLAPEAMRPGVSYHSVEPLGSFQHLSRLPFREITGEVFSLTVLACEPEIPSTLRSQHDR